MNSFKLDVHLVNLIADKAELACVIAVLNCLSATLATCRQVRERAALCSHRVLRRVLGSGSKIIRMETAKLLNLMIKTGDK